MAASYPGAIAAPRTVQNKTGVTYDATKTKILYAEDVNNANAEIVAVETELGTLPKGTKADVKTRLDDVDTAISGKQPAGNYITALTGDVAASGPGSVEATIAANAVTNAKAAQMATKTYKGRTSAATGNSEDVPVATLKTDLVLVKGDVGLGNVDNTSDTTKNAAVGTLTNKRINPRVGTIADSATPTPAGDDQDIFTVTALAQAATFGAPTGTPVNGQKLIIRILDNATARALSWNAIYRAGSDIALPTTTVLSKTLYCGFIYNSAASKWDLVAVTNNI